MNQRQRMSRVIPPQSKQEWRAVAVISKDAMAFAQELEGALQELSDGGFDVVSQMPRADGGLVVVGRRTVPADMAHQPTEPPMPPNGPGLRTRIVEMPLARNQGSTTDEVLYHYIQRLGAPPHTPEQRRFPTLVEALRVVKAHLEDERIVPVCLIAVTMTRFEMASFPSLLKMFAEDLPHEPG